jgi:hypothetical protein
MGTDPPATAGGTDKSAPSCGCTAMTLSTRPGHEESLISDDVTEQLLLPLQALTSCYISFVSPVGFSVLVSFDWPSIAWNAREVFFFGGVSIGGVTNGS